MAEWNNLGAENKRLARQRIQANESRNGQGSANKPESVGQKPEMKKRLSR